jgi:hypothetical protein
MSRGLVRRIAMLVTGAALLSALGGCYGVYSYGYYDPCPPPACAPVYVAPVCPAPVYVTPCRPVYRCGPRW